MGLFQWADKKVKSQTVWDVGVLKIFCTLVGIIAGAYISVFVQQNLWWFLILSFVLLVWLLFRFLRA